MRFAAASLSSPPQARSSIDEGLGKQPRGPPRVKNADQIVARPMPVGGDLTAVRQEPFLACRLVGLSRRERVYG